MNQYQSPKGLVGSGTPDRGMVVVRTWYSRGDMVEGFRRGESGSDEGR